ncbi:hypothetical protein A28LD_0217 [Idiomarina sp. A28L]|uniref:DUF4760 domain-containing protein n=1 Tax=Idiomarina sp. A28L TaxID=1036674 RepID=UPI0002138852|nr:DUF4760 domain-containing protein [Idiomarina sp. A28L]EGN76474.1 hypothetical protein A28LD_0217 [Idiomarina sp. A28L]
MRILLLIMSGLFCISSFGIAGWIYRIGTDSNGNGPFILISCFASLSAITLGWWVSLYIAQRQSTLSIITQSRLSESYLKQVQSFQQAFPSGQKLTSDKFNDPANEGARHGLISVLNFLEFISIGIKQNDLSESVCKAFFLKVFSNQWYRCSEVIKHMQTHTHSRTFENFEYYAKKWDSTLQ